MIVRCHNPTCSHAAGIQTNWASEVQRSLRALGWLITDEGEAYCPRCRKEAR